MNCVAYVIYDFPNGQWAHCELEADHAGNHIARFETVLEWPQ